MCCPMCVFNHLHDGHRVIEINNIETLNKENINLNNELDILNKNSDEIVKLKNKIEEEINKINNIYENTMKNLENHYQKKIEIILKEKNDFTEKINNGVTKVKESLENILTEINNEILIKERINKGIKKLENKEQNIFQIFTYISKMNRSLKKMKKLSTKLMRNINIKFDQNNNQIIFDEYYFNGWPIPSNIKIENLTSTSAKITWNIDNVNILNMNKNILHYAIEIRKDQQNFQYIYEGIYGANSYSINNLEHNTNYEIRISSYIGQENYFPNLSEWSDIYEFKTPDYANSIILKESNKESEFIQQLKEWVGFQKIELLFRASKDRMTHKNFYNKCNEVGPTIVLVKNKKGNIFGGYASVSWNNKNKKITEFNAPDSFLFSLMNIYNTSPSKFPSQKRGYEVRNYSNCGPAFGWGTDLGIQENENDICGRGWSWFPGSFKDTLGYGKSIFTGDLDNNNVIFEIQEVEVFKVIK